MIDTPILAIFMRKKSLKMWKRLYIAGRALSKGQYGILTMIDTPILAILYEKKSLKTWKRLYIARALSVGQ